VGGEELDGPKARVQSKEEGKRGPRCRSNSELHESKSHLETSQKRERSHVPTKEKNGGNKKSRKKAQEGPREQEIFAYREAEIKREDSLSKNNSLQNKKGGEGKKKSK